MTRRALVLDCDGVLADTERDGHLVAFNRAFAELGYSIEWSGSEYARLLRVGGGKERLKAYLAEHPEIDLARGGDFDQAVRAVHLQKSLIYVDLVEQGALPARPGVRRLVREALDTGWQVAVASTSAQRSVEAVLRTVVGEEDYARVSGVFAGDIVPAKKPAPDIYLLAIDLLGRVPEEVVVIEDSAAGATAASHAGLRHVVTVSTFTTEDAFPDASLVVDHLGEAERPATVRAGADVLSGKLVDVASLEAILR